RLGHEVNATEDDGRGGDPGGGPGQVEAVADHVGQVLDLAVLVVVSQEGGVPGGLEVADLVADVRQDCRGHERFLVFCVAEDQPTAYSVILPGTSFPGQDSCRGPSWGPGLHGHSPPLPSSFPETPIGPGFIISSVNQAVDPARLRPAAWMGKTSVA